METVQTFDIENIQFSIFELTQYNSWGWKWWIACELIQVRKLTDNPGHNLHVQPSNLRIYFHLSSFLSHCWPPGQCTVPDSVNTVIELSCGQVEETHYLIAWERRENLKRLQGFFCFCSTPDALTTTHICKAMILLMVVFMFHFLSKSWLSCPWICSSYLSCNIHLGLLLMVWL